jgi:hypothetical protein
VCGQACSGSHVMHTITSAVEFRLHRPVWMLGGALSLSLSLSPDTCLRVGCFAVSPSLALSRLDDLVDHQSRLLLVQSEVSRPTCRMARVLLL